MSDNPLDKIIKTTVEDINANREEILSAFIAKYGFEPDRAMQVQNGTSWHVRRMTDEEARQLKTLKYTCEECEDVERLREVLEHLIDAVESGRGVFKQIADATRVLTCDMEE